ncbi:TPA: hypothetical protein ON737_003239 [Morganella morganii]|nr:hypothetical protein [Morganella morganii]HCR3762220.1 hypothetical protein [Morganella morganii]HCT5327054.1 hypothetical protein [Morganella morganii]
MAEWKGVPYFFDANGLPEQLSVAVEKMPVVLIETPLAWETIVGMFASAAIAIWALISNFRLARLQNNYAIKKERANAILEAISKYITNADLSTQANIAYCNIKCNGGDLFLIGSEINSLIKELNHDHVKIKLLLDDDNLYHQELLAKLQVIINDLNNHYKIASNGSVHAQEEGDKISDKLDEVFSLSKKIISKLIN